MSGHSVRVDSHRVMLGHSVRVDRVIGLCWVIGIMLKESWGYVES